MSEKVREADDRTTSKATPKSEEPRSRTKSIGSNGSGQKRSRDRSLGPDESKKRKTDSNKDEAVKSPSSKSRDGGKNQDGGLKKHSKKDPRKFDGGFETDGKGVGHDHQTKWSKSNKSQSQNGTGEQNSRTHQRFDNEEVAQGGDVGNIKRPKKSHSLNGASQQSPRGHNRAPGSGRRKPSEQELQQQAKKLEVERRRLPIWSKNIDLRWALKLHDCMVLVGHTGSGKSTQVPQFLHKEPWCKKQATTIEQEDGTTKSVVVGGMIAVTQPRRVAAMTLAHRVADEMGSYLPETANQGAHGKVGYTVRFDANLPQGTVINYLTEGSLLQEMINDPYLTKYSCVIVDEIHERSLDVDLLAGFLRKILHGDLKGRGGIPLKVVIMSATMDLGGTAAFFAKPGTEPELYQPGASYGEVIAPYLQDKPKTFASVGKEFPPKPRERRPSLDELPSTTEILQDLASIPKDKALEIKPTDDKSRRSSSSTENSDDTWNGFSSPENDAIQKEDQGNKASQKARLNEPAKHATHNGLPSGVPLKGIVPGDLSATGVKIEQIRGTLYDVDIHWETETPENYMQTILEKIFYVHRTEPYTLNKDLKKCGDILVFLSGQDEIRELQAQIEKWSGEVKDMPLKLKAVPLYGSLPAQLQAQAFVRLINKDTRKVVLSTNIAETSVTVPGVRYIIDSGMVKVKQYHSKIGMDSLLKMPISKSSAIQRKGRAGREDKGKCWRIYTKEEYDKLPMDDLPEIMRSDPSEIVLKLMARGVKDVLRFPLMDAPEPQNVKKAIGNLLMLGAIGADGQLTSVGKQMASFPVAAPYGRVLVEAADKYDCLLDVIDVIAILDVENEVFVLPKSEDEREEIESNRIDITRREGDLITFLTTMQRYASENADRTAWCRQRAIDPRAMKKAILIRDQLRRICKQKNMLQDEIPLDPQPFEQVTPDRADIILKAFLTGFASKTAHLGRDGIYYVGADGQSNVVFIHPSSVKYGQKSATIMFLEHVYTTKSYVKKVSAIQGNWLEELV